MRTLIDLPEDDMRWLDMKAVEQGKSRAALVREAVASYRAAASSDWIARGAGFWKDRTDIGDAVAFQRDLRRDRGDD